MPGPARPSHPVPHGGAQRFKSQGDREGSAAKFGTISHDDTFMSRQGLKPAHAIGKAKESVSPAALALGGTQRQRPDRHSRRQATSPAPCIAVWRWQDSQSRALTYLTDIPDPRAEARAQLRSRMASTNTFINARRLKKVRNVCVPEIRELLFYGCHRMVAGHDSCLESQRSFLRRC